jgi:hypothetical protein
MLMKVTIARRRRNYHMLLLTMLTAAIKDLRANPDSFRRATMP